VGVEKMHALYLMGKPSALLQGETRWRYICNRTCGHRLFLFGEFGTHFHYKFWFSLINQTTSKPVPVSLSEKQKDAAPEKKKDKCPFEKEW